MQERPENFNHAGDDAEATLVTPRFDAEEARHAHPVVPLAEAQTAAPTVNSRAHVRRGLRHSWPPALLAVALLAVFAAGGVVASKVLRRTQPNPAAAQAPAAVAPAQAAEVPAEAQTPPAAEPPREEARAKRQTPQPRGRVEEDRPVFRGEDERDDKRFEEEGERRVRGKGRERRRGRDEDEAEKELRKAVKRAKDKAPRLVDVLVSP